jgi:hypothetical protein
MTRKRLNKNKVLQDIESTRGNLAAIARAYGISRQAVQKFVANDPELTEATNEARETMLDEAENALYDEAVEKRNTAALIFLLKTQGKKRGYIERAELTGADGKDLNTGPAVVILDK